MDRRGFLGLLGSLPFLGVLKKKSPERMFFKDIEITTNPLVDTKTQI